MQGRRDDRARATLRPDPLPQHLVRGKSVGRSGSSRLVQSHPAEITHFRLSALIFATIIHAVGSLLIGLLYGAMLPMLPRHPILLGGIIAPVLWTGVLHSSLPLINPYLADRIDWWWFVASQVTFGLVAGWVVSHQIDIRTEQYHALRGARGIGNTGNDGRSIGRTDRSDGAPPDTGFLYDCAWLRPASWPSQAWAGGAASRSVLDFATLYVQNCSGCHGAQGSNGPSYPLANPAYQSLVDEQILRQTIANGEPGTHMPPFAISPGEV